jgi:hypothetical protein
MLCWKSFERHFMYVYKACVLLVSCTTRAGDRYNIVNAKKVQKNTLAGRTNVQIAAGKVARRHSMAAATLAGLIALVSGWYASTAVHNTPLAEHRYVLMSGLLALGICAPLMWYFEVPEVERKALRWLAPPVAWLGCALLTAWSASMIFVRVTVLQAAATQLFLAGAVAMLLQLYPLIAPKPYAQMRKGYQHETIDNGPVIGLLVRPVHLRWFWAACWVLAVGMLVASRFI